jgi:hypothetical protein
MLYFEVRAKSDLVHFQKLIKYASIMQASDCLVIDCFYDFGHFKSLVQQLPFLELREYQ